MYRQSPSQMLRISHNDWLSYQLDRAVFTFGRFVEAELRAGNPSDAVRDSRLRKLLGLKSKPMKRQRRAADG